MLASLGSDAADSGQAVGSGRIMMLLLMLELIVALLGMFLGVLVVTAAAHPGERLAGCTSVSSFSFVAVWRTGRRVIGAATQLTALCLLRRAIGSPGRWPDSSSLKATKSVLRVIAFILMALACAPDYRVIGDWPRTGQALRHREVQWGDRYRRAGDPMAALRGLNISRLGMAAEGRRTYSASGGLGPRAPVSSMVSGQAGRVSFPWSARVTRSTNSCWCSCLHPISAAAGITDRASSEAVERPAGHGRVLGQRYAQPAPR